ncbi:hypothetical protein Tco_0939435 [Tanacetum coccineum]|uniref:Uncharacterized protein n=1 Tax=Tanacetum coccineum TaxID=301880 RepID=A0ABQ5DK48_9ASTR
MIATGAPNLAEERFQKFCKLSEHHWWERFWLHNPILINSRLPHENVLVPSRRREQAHKVDAPHVKRLSQTWKEWWPEKPESKDLFGCEVCNHDVPRWVQCGKLRESQELHVASANIA